MKKKLYRLCSFDIKTQLKYTLKNMQVGMYRNVYYNTKHHIILVLTNYIFVSQYVLSRQVGRLQYILILIIALEVVCSMYIFVSDQEKNLQMNCQIYFIFQIRPNIFYGRDLRCNLSGFERLQYILIQRFENHQIRILKEKKSIFRSSISSVDIALFSLIRGRGKSLEK